MAIEATNKPRRKVWIDLDNSPHVPFFLPIIGELQKRGCSVMLTARDAYQVCDLADHFGLSYVRLGKHHGKNLLMKSTGTILRSLQLLRVALTQQPDLALSHGSRAQLLTSAMIGIPSITMLDYEFVARVPFVKATWLMAPTLIPASAIRRNETDVMRYPGIKEDVYTAGFKPDPGFRSQFGLSEEDLIVTLRPPASEAHYHNPASEILLHAVIEVLMAHSAVRVLVVPRNSRQASGIRSSWPDLLQNGKMIIPAKAVDGLNLIWHSDLVISGGGTMNREAAALGVPVYSIFRGQIGAVDAHLSREGRLVLLETVEDVRTKLTIERRKRSSDDIPAAQPALQAVVENILAALNSGKANPVASTAKKLVVGATQ